MFRSDLDAYLLIYYIGVGKLIHLNFWIILLPSKCCWEDKAKNIGRVTFDAWGEKRKAGSIIGWWVWKDVVESGLNKVKANPYWVFFLPLLGFTTTSMEHPFYDIESISVNK